MVFLTLPPTPLDRGESTMLHKFVHGNSYCMLNSVKPNKGKELLFRQPHSTLHLVSALLPEEPNVFGL